MKFMVALSGGVDSSVVAGLLVEQGHDVVGVTLKLAPDVEGPGAARRCCSVDDAVDARAVCTHLKIPFYVLNAQALFTRTVVEPFVAAYRSGQTPIPCVGCNTHLKFGHLLERAQALGATLATGHYVRKVPGPWGPQLHRPADKDRDQTYFLQRLGHAVLDRVEFPLGEMEKPAVRAHARRLGLPEPISAKPDSQEICFVPQDGHGAFVERWDGLGPTPGVLLDGNGATVGTHQGVHGLTVGQRKGLGVSHHPNRLYVLQLDAARQEAVLGPQAELMSQGLCAGEVSWLVAPQELPALLAQPVEVQIRARHQAAPAVVELDGKGGVRVAFAQPQFAVAPGQHAALYLGTRCVGGAIIEAPMSPWRSPFSTAANGHAVTVEGIGTMVDYPKAMSGSPAP